MGPLSKEELVGKLLSDEQIILTYLTQLFLKKLEDDEFEIMILSNNRQDTVDLVYKLLDLGKLLEHKDTRPVRIIGLYEDPLLTGITIIPTESSIAPILS